MLGLLLVGYPNSVSVPQIPQVTIPLILHPVTLHCVSEWRFRARCWYVGMPANVSASGASGRFGEPSVQLRWVRMPRQKRVVIVNDKVQHGYKYVLCVAGTVRWPRRRLC